MPDIAVISLGTSLNVPASADAALQSAELVIGAPRHLAAVDCDHARTCVYPSPLSDLTHVLAHSKAARIAVLASGDALFFGIGNWLLQNTDPESLHFYPNVSSVQSACARIGQPWQDMQFLSLHGRPLTRLRAILPARGLLAVFTDGENTPEKIAAELSAVGYGASCVHVFESLDSSSERIHTFRADQLEHLRHDFQPLNLLIIQIKGSGGLLPRFPGIADELFGADGDNMFTKREVRLAALSRLQPGAGEIAWDIGAGSGGIAIELARWAPQSQVIAIERNARRRDVFVDNQVRFGDHGNLTLVAGEAPQVLTDLPDPDAIYIGGSGGLLATLLDICWQRLRPGGRLVAAGVTMETRSTLQNRSWPDKVTFSDITIGHATPLGDQTVIRAQLPVLLATITKSVSNH